MSKSSREIIRDFYQRDLLNDNQLIKDFFHKDISIYWNGSEGLTIMNINDLESFINSIKKSYAELRVEISHLLAQRNFVTVRHNYYVRTYENIDEEIGVAHFMAIWELKDGKIIRGHLITQPASKNGDFRKGYEAVKI